MFTELFGLADNLKWSMRSDKRTSIDNFSMLQNDEQNLMTRFYSTIVLHSLFIVCLKKYTTSQVHHNNGSVVNEQDAFSSTSPYTSYTLAEAISQLRACECLLSIRLVCCAGVCCLLSSCCEYTTFCAILGLQRSITAGDSLLYTRTALLLRFSSPFNYSPSEWWYS